MRTARTWRFKVATGFIAATMILTGCGDDGEDDGGLTETETETEVEIPGVDEPELEPDE